MQGGVVKLSHFLWQADVLCKSIGFMPYDDGSKPIRFQKIKKWIFIILTANLILLLLQEFTFIAVSIMSGEHFKEVVMNFSYVGFGVISLIKAFSVLKKKSLLTTLMRQVQQSFPTDAKLQEDFAVRRFMIRFNLISFGFVFLYEVLLWFYNLYVVASYLIYDYWLGWNVVPLNLPYNAWVPWQWQGNWSFYLLYILQNLAAHTGASCLLANDLILCAVATQLSMHYRYLANRIKKYQPTLIYAKDKKFLKHCIEYHQKIMCLSKYMNEVFGVSLLINFISSSFIVCFLGFQMTIGAQTDFLLLLFLFLCCSLLQVMMICYYSEDLTAKSLNIGNAVYNQNWLLTDVRYRKMLILIIQRAQNPTVLKATTFLNVSMGTMAKLIQMSYKLFALLRTLYFN